MKIHSIRVFNIASLAGNHNIDFDYITQNSNLFAITGKTGSGKSTLLNAISLALYGLVYKTTTNNSDYITLGKDAGEIDIVYSCGLKKYKASWRLRIKKKNGDLLKKPQLNRTFFKIENDEDIPIDISPEETLGLSFSQFCKTSILNQGEFSKFLNSKFTERKEILEKLYEGENLELINQVLKKKLKLATEKKEKVLNLIDGINETLQSDIISKEQLEINKAGVSSLEKNLKLFNSVIKNGKDIIGLHETITNNEQRLTNTQNLQRELQLDYNSKLKAFKELEKVHNTKADHLESRKPFLITAVAKRQKLLSLNSQILELENKIKGQKSQLGHLDKDLKTQEKSLEGHVNRRTSAIKLYPFLENLDHSLFEKSFNDLLQLTNHNNQISKEKTKAINNIDSESLRLSNITKEIEDLESKIIEITPLKNSKVEDLNTKVQNLLRVKLLIQSFWDKHKKNNIKIEELLLKIKELEKKVEKASTDLKLTELTIEKINKTIKISELSHAIHTLTLESKKNRECALCHQLVDEDHKFPSINDNSFSKEDEDELVVLKERQELLINNISNLTTNAKAFELQKLHLDNEISQNRIDHVSQVKELKSTMDEVSQDFSSNNLDLLENKINEINLQLDKNKEIHKSYQLMINNIQTKKELSEEFKKNLLRFSGEVKVLVEQHNKNKKSILKLSEIYKVFSESFDEVQKINQYRIEFEKIESAIALSKVNIAHIKSTRNDFSSRKENLEKEHSIALFEKDQVNAYITEHEIPENPELSLRELEINFKESQREVETLKKSLKDLDISLAEVKSKSSNYQEQIEQSLLLRDGHLKEFSSHIEIILKEKSVIKEQETLKILEKLKSIDSTKYNHEIFNLTLEKFIHIEQEFELTYKETRDHFIRDENNFNLFEKNKLIIEKYKSELQKHNDELNKLNDLNTLIGKDEFRNYVLSIIENNLLIQTNEELKLLCQGRYYLTQTNKANKMASEFLIIDNFRDAMARKVATLSGGETFLVSLAMAMALAELTRGNTQIDSLFIDEGFGTLDNESINEVYELLQNIQLSGKQLGIISHVQALTSRIPINIQLEKNQNGLSEINILLN